MAIFQLYSKRQKKLRGEVSDVYSYEEIPVSLRVQIVHIIKNTIGAKYNNSYYNIESEADKIYKFIHQTLCKEYGVFTLKEHADDYEAIYDTFLKEKDYEKCLDIIEISFRIIENYVTKNWHLFRETSSQKPDDAIEELNLRFKESAVGYQFESGDLIRIDSQIIHSEVVKPTLVLLASEDAYNGANNEFLSAHEHYRHKRYKECLNDCLKSFESIMKGIHIKRNWAYSPQDTASKLINSCLSNELIPTYIQSQFTSLKTMLESGVPTLRNKNSGHGQGATVTQVNEELVSYMLHLTATNLLYLVQCDKKLS